MIDPTKLAPFFGKRGRIRIPGEWRLLLANPEKQWQAGHSAWALAHCWLSAEGLPERVRNTLSESQLDLHLAVVEYSGYGEAKGHKSQTDIMAVCMSEAGPVIIAVEGKAGEPFDETVHDWLSNAESESSLQNRTRRLNGCLRLLGLRKRAVLGVRYQLLHRMCSAVDLAKKLMARKAVMLIHSFGHAKHYEDFVAFVRLFDGSFSSEPADGRLAILRRPKSGLDLTIAVAWVQDDEKWLT